MTNATIVTAKRTSEPKDLFAGFSTSRDSTFAYLRAGGIFDLSLEGGGHMEYISGRGGFADEETGGNNGKANILNRRSFGNFFRDYV